MDGPFGSRLILVSGGLYLFASLPPLSAASAGPAWPVILNRPLTFPTFPRGVQFQGFLWEALGGGRRASREGGGGQMPSGPAPGGDSDASALQMNTGLMRVRAEPKAYYLH